MDSAWINHFHRSRRLNLQPESAAFHGAGQDDGPILSPRDRHGNRCGCTVALQLRDRFRTRIRRSSPSTRSTVTHS